MGQVLKVHQCRSLETRLTDPSGQSIVPELVRGEHVDVAQFAGWSRVVIEIVTSHGDDTSALQFAHDAIQVIRQHTVGLMISLSVDLLTPGRFRSNTPSKNALGS